MRITETHTNDRRPKTHERETSGNRLRRIGVVVFSLDKDNDLPQPV